MGVEVEFCRWKSRLCPRRLLLVLSRPPMILLLCAGVYMTFLMWSHMKAMTLGPHLVQVDWASHTQRSSPLLQSSTADLPSKPYASALNDMSVNTSLPYGGTLVIQVRGEMGNHLQKIAHGYGLRWLAQEEFQFTPHLLVRHLKKAKWMTARADIYQCFPNLRLLDYKGGHQPAFQRVRKSQVGWFEQQDPGPVKQLDHVRDETLANITEGLQAMKELVVGRAKPFSDLPIVVLGGPMRNALIDKYYDYYRELFAFDTEACCAQLPEPDEVVFHFRHFAKELSLEEQRSRGFEELDPPRVASLLLGHLKAGQKVAMTTRFGNNSVVQEYLAAMEERKLQVRLVINQTGVQDFCFLLRAKKELLGVAKSTYTRWAAYLGDARRVQLYALDNVGSRDFINQTMRFPWTHSELTRRIQFPVFMSPSSFE